ncbi:MAG: type Z 30S ribosomal protein S14 [Patescibacteria group bacterium]
MARQALIQKALKKPKYSSRIVRRCSQCGRKAGYLRKFDMCRICVREAALRGELVGFFKSSN